MINLRPATIKDMGTIYEWRNHPWIIDHSLSGGPVSWVEHKNWYPQKIVASDIVMFIIEEDDVDEKYQEAGELRFDCVSPEEAEVTIFLLPEFIGRGLGTLALKEGCKKVFRIWTSLKSIRARILLNNSKSRRTFGKVGFVEDTRFEDHLEMVLTNDES